MIRSAAYLEHKFSGPLTRLLPATLTTLLLAAVVITLVLKTIPTDHVDQHDVPVPTAPDFVPRDAWI